MTNYHNICSKVHFVETCTNYYKFTRHVKFAVQQIVPDTNFT